MPCTFDVCQMKPKNMRYEFLIQISGDILVDVSCTAESQEEAFEIIKRDWEDWERITLKSMQIEYIR